MEEIREQDSVEEIRAGFSGGNREQVWDWIGREVTMASAEPPVKQLF